MIALILFYYVFGLTAILLTIYVVRVCVQFIREGRTKKEDDKP